jgi:hypothetical protein
MLASARESGLRSLCIVFGCDWPGCPVTPGGAETREFGVNLTEHCLRRGFALAQHVKPAEPWGGCEAGSHAAPLPSACRLR